MRILGSFGAASHGAEPETDVHPALRGHNSLWSVLGSIVLGCFFLLIAVKGWKQLSASALYWMGFSFYWSVFLFRTMPIANSRLRMILAVDGVEPVDKKRLLDRVLNVTTEALNKMLYFCCLSFLGLLMAIAAILSKHYPW
jgi:hypothetical protein